MQQTYMPASPASPKKISTGKPKGACHRPGGGDRHPFSGTHFSPLDILEHALDLYRIL